MGLPSVPFMTKHNEQHLQVLSCSNSPQAKNPGSIDQQLRFTCFLLQTEKLIVKSTQA